VPCNPDRVRTLEPVEQSFFVDAPVTVTTHTFVAAARGAVFAAISGDPAGWGDWCPGFNHDGRWQSPSPHGVGSIRTVRAFRTTYRETILAWDADERWAFRVDATSSPLFAAFAEDYRFADAGPGTLLSWTVAFRPGRVIRLVTAVTPAVFGLIARKLAKDLGRAASGPSSTWG
jgi:Polyketide cyclase / dehydrase and lipid transport